jgi:transcriptional regulator with XRE-family HTH domain
LKKHLRTRRHRALCQVLAKAREAAGLTQRELAAKIGRSDSFIWKIEAGERRVEVLEFMDIAEAVGVGPAELMRRLVREA